jgi:hypothetical protein
MFQVSVGCTDGGITSGEPHEASSALDADDWEQRLVKTGEKTQSLEYSPSMTRDVNGLDVDEEAAQVGPCLGRGDLDGAAKEDRQRG